MQGGIVMRVRIVGLNFRDGAKRGRGFDGVPFSLQCETGSGLGFRKFGLQFDRSLPCPNSPFAPAPFGTNDAEIATPLAIVAIDLPCALHHFTPSIHSS